MKRAIIAALCGLLFACGHTEQVFAQSGGCVKIETADRPVQVALDPGAMAEAFASGGPVIWWRPLSHQIMGVLKEETGRFPVMQYRAIVVTERHEHNSTVMSVFLLSVNLDSMCFAGDFPVTSYWEWREALVGRPA